MSNDRKNKNNEDDQQLNATLSAVTNMIDIVQGKKDPKESCMEVAQTAVSRAKDYVQTEALTIINRTLLNSKSEILKCLGESNVVGKAIKNPNEACMEVAKTAVSGAFNVAGIEVDQSSATYLSAVTNMIDIVQGKKDPKESCMEVAQTAVSRAKDYVQTEALTIINRTLLNSKSEILKCLGESNVVGKAITACQVVGDTFIKLLNSEIDLGEATERISKQASQAVIISEAAGIGQLMIPIPFVGAAVGSLVGMFVCKGMMDFFETLEKRKQHIEELQEMQRQYDQVTQFFHKYRLEYQNFAQKFNLEKKEFFTEQLLNIDDGLLYENYEQVTKATNNITTALGGEVLYDNLDDFCDFLDS